MTASTTFLFVTGTIISSIVYCHTFAKFACLCAFCLFIYNCLLSIIVKLSLSQLHKIFGIMTAYFRPQKMLE